MATPGRTWRRTLDAVVEELASAPTDMDAVCHAIAHGSLMGARGNSGVILSQILRGFAGVAPRCDRRSTGTIVADGLTAASDAAYDAVLTPVEGTILTVARGDCRGGCGRRSRGRVARRRPTCGASRRPRRSLARTPDLLPVLRDAGVVDAGGAGFLLLLDAALFVVAGEPIPEPVAVDDAASDQPRHRRPSRRPARCGTR